jgi:hypothetical protein
MALLSGFIIMIIILLIFMQLMENLKFDKDSRLICLFRKPASTCFWTGYGMGISSSGRVDGKLAKHETVSPPKKNRSP